MANDKKIGTLVAMAVGLGAIIGAGIFVLSGTAIALAGANALIAFILVGIVALIMAFEFGELGSIFPHVKGAAYSYVYKAFGSELGFITGLIKYFSYATAISVISLGFGSYFTSLFGISITGGSILFAILLIIILSVLNLLGLKKAAKTDSFLVIIKTAALLAFIGFAVFFVAHSGGIKVSNFSVSSSQGTLAALFAASIVIFFAYSGFQTIVTLTPEIKGGGRAAAKATIYAVVISIVLYVAVVAALLLLLPASHFTVSGDPLALALMQSGAPNWLLIVVDVGALVATASAALAMLIASSRMLYQVGVDRLLTPILQGLQPQEGCTHAGHSHLCYNRDGDAVLRQHLHHDGDKQLWTALRLPDDRLCGDTLPEEKGVWELQDAALPVPAGRRNNSDPALHDRHAQGIAGHRRNNDILADNTLLLLPGGEGQERCQSEAFQLMLCLWE